MLTSIRKLALPISKVLGISLKSEKTWSNEFYVINGSLNLTFMMILVFNIINVVDIADLFYWL